MKRGVSLLAIFLAACSTVQTTDPGAVGVERKQLMIVSFAPTPSCGSVNVQAIRT